MANVPGARTRLADLFGRPAYQQMEDSLKLVFESGQARERESELDYPDGRRTISTWLVPLTDDHGG